LFDILYFAHPAAEEVKWFSAPGERARSRHSVPKNGPI
jgi:hypothetical protein